MVDGEPHGGDDVESEPDGDGPAAPVAIAEPGGESRTTEPGETGSGERPADGVFVQLGKSGESSGEKTDKAALKGLIKTNSRNFTIVSTGYVGDVQSPQPDHIYRIGAGISRPRAQNCSDNLSTGYCIQK